LEPNQAAVTIEPIAFLRAAEMNPRIGAAF
jgi:hypothetical protein